MKASKIKQHRSDMAKRIIARCGGPTKMAEQLSDAVGRYVDKERVAKWRYIGIPVVWGPVIVTMIPDVSLHEMNPWEFTTNTQYIHNNDLHVFLRI